MGKPSRWEHRLPRSEYIGSWSEPGEVNHLSTQRKRKQISDSVSSGERTRKSLNFRSVKPDSVASRGSWDLFGDDVSRPGKLKN